MIQSNRNERAIRSANIQRIVSQEIDAVRKAWRLTPPEANYREPLWFKSAATEATKAGRLPKRGYGGSVTSQLHAAGYHKALDHIAVVLVDGERHVIFEPYESRCSMDTARRIAAELAILLRCDAWVSMHSWHYPGLTIRITLAPSQIQPATHCEHDLVSSGSHNASATMSITSEQPRSPESHHHIDVGGKYESTT